MKEISRYLTRSVLVLIVALFLYPVGGLLWSVLEIDLPFEYFEKALVGAVFLIYLSWFFGLANLKPKEKLPRFRNTPIEGSERINVRYSTGRTATVFRHMVGNIFGGDEDDAEQEIAHRKQSGTPFRLPNGRVIGTDRLKSVLIEMSRTRDLTRNFWLQRGLSRREWEGILSFLDQEDCLVKVDGRGKAYIKPSLIEDISLWERYVTTLLGE